jgi:mannosyltransferase OCH1-like enzyme
LTHLSKIAAAHFPQPFPASTTCEEDYSVPKKLHFLWVESDIPLKYMNAVNSFSKMNPDYEVFLWLDRDLPHGFATEEAVKPTRIEQLDLELLPLMNKMAARIDYIRYEVMYRFGGIYCDIDSVPLNPFDGNLESAFVSYGNDIQNSFFGFAPRSNFMSSMLKAISHYRYMSDSERGGPFHAHFTGGHLMGACLWASQDKGIRCISEVLTGHAPTWIAVSNLAYCRHMYEWNWRDPNDPAGKN